MLIVKELQWIILAIIGAALLYLWQRGFEGVGKDIVTGAVNVVEGATEESVETVSSVIGIPETSMTECELAMNEGRTLDASFACPAGVFLEYLFNAGELRDTNVPNDVIEPAPDSSTDDPLADIPDLKSL